ncbi:MAG: hypothetical protein ACUVQK_06645 [Thermogutta sp.]
MMLCGKTREELLVLLEAVVNETISPAQHRRLEEILTSSAEARSIYLDYLDMHAGLRAVALGQGEGQQVSSIVAMVREDASAARRGMRDGRSSPRLWVAVIAAGVMIAVLAGWLLGKLSAKAPPTETPKDLEHVATIVRWAGTAAEGSVIPVEGRRLAPNDVLSLTDGNAEIVFDGGPRVILQGETRVRIQSASDAELLYGRVVIRADETAGRFRMPAGDSLYTYRATEFFMEVGRDGTCALHVRLGEVRRERMSEDGKRLLSRETVVAGQARVFPPQAETGSPTSFDPERFAAAWPTDTTTGTDDILAEEHFSAVSPDPIALVAARGAEFEDGPGWSGRWVVGPGDVPNIVADQWFGSSRNGLRQIPGVLSVEGQAVFHRRLARALVFHRNSVYYLGFIVKWDRASGGQGGWFSVSLDAADNPRTDPITVGLWVDRQLVFARADRSAVRNAIPIETGREYLCLVKLAADEQGRTEVFVRVFPGEQPPNDVEPDAWNLVFQAAVPESLPDTVLFRVDTASRWYLDQLRLAKTWRGVVSPWLHRSTSGETITAVLPHSPHPRLVRNP